MNGEPRNNIEREEHKLLRQLEDEIGTNYKARVTVQKIVNLYHSELDVLHFELIALEATQEPRRGHTGCP